MSKCITVHAVILLENGLHLYIERKRLVVVFVTNKNTAEAMFISTADGEKEQREAGKLISNMFIILSKARGREPRGQEVMKFMGNVVLIWRNTTTNNTTGVTCKLPVILTVVSRVYSHFTKVGILI